MEPEGSLLCSQVPVAESCLSMSTQVFAHDSFPSGFESNEVLYALLISPMRAVCLTRFIMHSLIILLGVCGENKL
jgi:hypothetical protein